MVSEAELKPRLLVTVRDAGPAKMIAALLPELARTFTTAVLCDAFCRAGLGSGDDFQWIESGFDPHESCATALAIVRPDIVLRTTPAYGFGVDEAIGCALEPEIPMFCLQDHYGLGRDLARVERMGVTDGLARDCAPEGAASRVDVLGWLSHERFLKAEPWRSARDVGRAKLGLRPGDLAVCYVCINEVEPMSGREDIAAFLDAASTISAPSRWSVRPHPAMSAAEARWCARAAHESGLNILDTTRLGSEREWLSAFDLLVSPASIMLVDALAFRLTDPEPLEAGRGDLACLYLTTRRACAAMAAASGLERFPTHYPGRGFALGAEDDLAEALAAALEDDVDRAALIAAAATHFRPSLGVASRTCAWLEKGLRH